MEAALDGHTYLDRYNHQGWYGECFIQVLASAAGLQAYKPVPDCTGVDLQIGLPSEIEDDFPRMEVQVKTWSTPKESGNSWRYGRLDEKRFNLLVGKRIIPRFLFLVIVPPEGDRYAMADPAALTLSHAAYWVSLAGQPKIPNPSSAKHVQVAVPKSNLLSVDSLVKLFEPLRAVEAP
ncbi:DUF4365 domain-containing protein [Nonomuraea sp. 10N515B]|uniref:DUF4365 domain-containing protein n=1 Tax=Nonomuraea sp. 10N515B TaxID=3457422 RepID=UPI003FCD6B06